MSITLLLNTKTNKITLHTHFCTIQQLTEKVFTEKKNRLKARMV